MVKLWAKRNWLKVKDDGLKNQHRESKANNNKGDLSLKQNSFILLDVHLYEKGFQVV